MLHLLYHNIFIRLALVLLISGILILFTIVPPELALFWLKILCLSVIFLIVVAIINEFLFLRSEQAKYIDLSLLLMKTRELENILGSFGAEGKGLYEKAEYIFPNDKELLNEVFFIAKARNDAMHGDAKIKNLKEVLEKSKKIKKYFLSIVPLSTRIINYIASFIVFANSGYLLTLTYIKYTHDLGKLLLWFILFYTINSFFYKTFGAKNYLVIVFLVLLYSILLMYENGKYLFMLADRIKDAF